MKIENSRIAFSTELTDREAAEIQRIYKHLFDERCELGPRFIFEVVLRFLYKNGYKVVDNKSQK